MSDTQKHFGKLFTIAYIKKIEADMSETQFGFRNNLGKKRNSV